ncbi:MAG: phosphatase PAP2 family protein [Desulfobacterales bacterium]
MRYPLKRLMQRLGTPEKSVLVMLVLIVSGVWAFTEIADEVLEAEPVGIDERVLNFLWESSEAPAGPEWLEEAARDITSLGSYSIITLLGGIVAVYFGLKRRFGLMLLTVAAVAGGALVSTGLKILFARERPSLDHLVRVVTYSFPSGHAMLSAVVYLTLGVLLAYSEPRRRFKIYFMSVAALLAVLVGLTRIYLGVHFPTDVLAGWIAGAVWALCCLLIAESLRRRALTHPPAPSHEAGDRDVERRLR